EQNRRAQFHPQQHAESRADGDEQFSAPKNFAQQRGQKQHGGPRFAKARFERINQRGEFQLSHSAREEQSAENQTDAETQAALRAQANASFVSTFDRAEQKAAIHPVG